MKHKNYNGIDWSIHFYLDASSPSGLRWNKDVTVGFNGSFLMHIKHNPAGSVTKRGNGKVKAWSVCVGGVSYFAHRVIWVLTHGGIEDNLVIDHIDGNVLNNNIYNLRLVNSQVNAQNTKIGSKNKSGIVGVFMSKDREGKYYWRATWANFECKPRSKSFYIHKYGGSEAFRLACEYRTAQIALLNENGANYTLRHGSA